MVMRSLGRSGAPPLNIAAVEKRDRIAAMDEIKRAIEVAEQAPFQFLMQHVGVGGESSTEQKLESAMTSLEHLRAFAKPLGVQVVVENIPNELSTPEGWWSCCTRGASPISGCVSTWDMRTWGRGFRRRLRR